MITSPTDVEHFDRLLDYLRQSRAFDFAAYKRTSLMRRVVRRMQMVGVGTFEAYLDYIQVHQDEFAALFNTILINVTSFFRDEDVWRYLSSTVLPQLLSEREEQRLRVWSAGAASGQEAYTVVLALAELVGADAVRERVKVYATDVDEQALSEARSGVYSQRAVENVPKPLLDKYFERTGSSYTLNRDLQRTVIFGRHDLVQDAPISHIDLLLCRNTLMYFNAETQARILARFHVSLNPGGCLVLGRAEMLFSHAAMFAPLDLKRRVFRSVPRPEQLRDASFECGPDPIMVVDDGMAQLEEVTLGDVTELRALRSELQRSKQELDSAYEELQTTNEELETTNEALQSTVEELESANEELQSTNVELETMNEALRNRSTNLDTQP